MKPKALARLAASKIARRIAKCKKCTVYEICPEHEGDDQTHSDLIKETWTKEGADHAG